MLSHYLTLCFLMVTLFVSAEPYKLIQNKTKLPILTPAFADQKTLKIKLENGLEAFLVSDPKADQSGAVLSVKVGSWDDPKEFPGLAHFLEHMLFLGTSKYPEESEYFRFITSHGGQAMAFTMPSATSFYFTVDNNAFEGALDRFSYFFKEPLFNPSGVKREMNAVDQEYGKNIENDAIRQFYVQKELSNPHHPKHHFNMGNKKSLAKATREVLQEFYTTHYSANLMKLFVYSNLPIEELRDTVVEDFSKIPTINRHPLEVHQKASHPDLASHYVYIEPVKNKRELTIYWELPQKFINMRDSKPENVICHVIGHEGERSLLAELKKEKLAESLSCGGLKTSDDLLELYIEVKLTEEGLKQKEQVITLVFQTIEQLRQKGLPNYIFDELHRMAKIKYQYPTKKSEYDTLTWHAQMLHEEPMETYPERTLVIQKPSPQGVKDLLSFLTPQNARFIILAPSQETGEKLDRQEKWLGASYAIRPISEKDMQHWELVSPNSSINLPVPNTFIPDDLRLVDKTPTKSDRYIPSPKPIIKNEFATIYYAQDTTFNVPKVSWIFTLRTPEITMEDRQKIVMGDLYVKLIKDALNKFSYPAQIAGLNYDVSREKNGIRVKVKGYSQNANLLFREIVNTIKNFEPDPNKFKIYKESLIRKYRNFQNESPLDQAIEILKSVIYKSYVTESEKAVAIRKLSFKKFNLYTESLFSKMFVEGMLYGNLKENDAVQASNEIILALKKEPYPREDWYKDSIVIFPPEKGPFYLNCRTQSMGNATVLAVEYPKFSFKNRAAQQILMKGIKEPFFATLRTKQQTGYLVHSLDQEVERLLFNFFLVQSNTHSSRDLLARFEAFIEGFLQELGKSELSEPDFESFKKSQIAYLKQNPKNLIEMGDFLNLLAFDYEADFDWVQKRIGGLENLTYSEFLHFSKDFLGRSNKQRLAILLNGEIPEDLKFSYQMARSKIALRKLVNYKDKIISENKN